ncbi:MAG: glycosyltransferase family 4 protein [Verrucomicrobia bacterium]|nr:glycosyltransferase family 4 protein [Verrucomicrobiota bacterium]
MTSAQPSAPAPARPASAGGPAAQIIGLVKNRLSGIVLSRHAYADVLRTLWPDLRDATVSEGKAAPCAVNVWAARPLSKVFLDDMSRRMPGLQIWCIVLESTQLPQGSMDACANSDQVWAPSGFVRDMCVAGGMPAEKVHVIPYWLPMPARPRILPAAGSPYTVLVSWDGRSSINRKNVINSIAAFKLAWSSDPDVRLRLKTRDLTPENVESVTAAIAGDARITLDMRTTDSIDEVFDGAHVLLHLHRAEGYGRHIIEAMQRRLPVIATAYSGPMDWLREDNARLVGHHLVDTAQKEFQYPQGGQWAEPDLNHAARHLRECREADASGALHGMLDRAELAACRHTTLEFCRAAMIAALSQAGAISPAGGMCGPPAPAMPMAA